MLILSFMWHRLTFLALAVPASAFVGCKTLHTSEAARQSHVATWSPFLVVDKDGRKVPAPDDLIVSSLRKVGIIATTDETGLHIAPEDEERAMYTLLTDERLAESGILVIVPVFAGSGRRTPDGIAFTLPTTQPAD